MSKKYIIISVILIIIVAVIGMVITRASRSTEYEELFNTIDQEVEGCKGLDPRFDKVKADQGFDATHFAHQIHSAKGNCWLCDDDEEQVYNALRGRTASEIKAIEAVMQRDYSTTILEYLDSFLADDEYAIAEGYIDNSLRNVV